MQKTYRVRIGVLLESVRKTPSLLAANLSSVSLSKAYEYKHYSCSGSLSVIIPGANII
jgi:hypothetical protein